MKSATMLERVRVHLPIRHMACRFVIACAAFALGCGDDDGIDDADGSTSTGDASAADASGDDASAGDASPTLDASSTDASGAGGSGDEDAGVSDPAYTTDLSCGTDELDASDPDEECNICLRENCCAEWTDCLNDPTDACAFGGGDFQMDGTPDGEIVCLQLCIIDSLAEDPDADTAAVNESCEQECAESSAIAPETQALLECLLQPTVICDSDRSISVVCLNQEGTDQ